MPLKRALALHRRHSMAHASRYPGVVPWWLRLRGPMNGAARHGAAFGAFRLAPRTPRLGTPPWTAWGRVRPATRLPLHRARRPIQSRRGRAARLTPPSAEAALQRRGLAMPTWMARQSRQRRFPRARAADARRVPMPAWRGLFQRQCPRPRAPLAFAKPMRQRKGPAPSRPRPQQRRDQIATCQSASPAAERPPLRAQAARRVAAPEVPHRHGRARPA